MAKASVKLVNHTSEQGAWLSGLQQAIQKLFDECLKGLSNSAIVSWGTGAGSDNLVLHFVQDVDHSYVQAKLPGAALKEHIAGHTRTQKGVTGTEFYLFTGPAANRSRSKYIGYAKIALHESLYNLFPGLSEAELHGRQGGGGLAASPPKLPPTEKNKEMINRGLSNKNKQLL
jgi:hypothetical protein